MKLTNANNTIAAPGIARIGWRALMTHERWIEVARIVFAGLMALLFWQELIPVQLLWGAVAVGLYPLVKTGVLDLIQERK